MPVTSSRSLRLTSTMWRSKVLTPFGIATLSRIVCPTLNALILYAYPGTRLEY